MVRVKCTMCTFEGDNSIAVLQHVVRKHKNNPSFSVQCQFGGCGSTFQKWNSYKVHLRRKHPDVPTDIVHEVEQHGNPQDGNLPQDENPQDENPQDENPQDENLPQNDPTPVSAEDLLMWKAGKFLALLREEGNISQNAVNIVIAEVNDILETYVHTFQAKLKATGRGQESLSFRDIDNVFADMKSKGLFDGVSSKFLLDKFLTANGKVDPVKVYLGKDTFWSQSVPPRIIEKDIFAYILPLKSTLQQLLSHPEILNYVLNPVENTDGTLKDVTDGTYYKTHSVFSNNRQSIIIIFYYDDLQTSNVLGPKKHKFSMFYWTLANVPPHLRSSLRAINLYGIVRTKHLKQFGVGEVLKPFLSDIKQLETDGMNFVVKGQEVRNFRGGLLFVTADTPAAQFLGGYKESVASALSPCRSCDATQDTMQQHFSETAFTLRCKETHEEQVGIVTDPTISKEAAKHHSKQFGITGESAFAALEGFDVTQCFVQDFMHVILEGVLPLEIQEFLKYVVRDKQLVTLKKLNHLIASYNYGHLTRDKPSDIEDAHLDNALREHSLQCLALGHVLPFLLKPCVESDPEAVDKLNNLVLLLQICNLALSYELTEEDVVLLEHMIVKHHTLFKILYPGVKLTPKFHFMIHFPRQLLQFGPLRHQWCVRFEGAHAYFKRLMAIVLSYRNPCYTMVNRHSSKRAVQLLCYPGHHVSNFLDLGDKVGTGCTLLVSDHPYQDVLKLAFTALTGNDLVMSANFIQVKGTQYKKKSVILIKRDPNEFPMFGRVAHIIVRGQEKLLLYRPMNTLHFEETLNAYKVEDNNISCRSVFVRDLPFPYPLSVWRCAREDYVLLFNAVPEFFG